jgi:hypothetical protein
MRDRLAAVTRCRTRRLRSCCCRTVLSGMTSPRSARWSTITNLPFRALWLRIFEVRSGGPSVFRISNLDLGAKLYCALAILRRRQPHVEGHQRHRDISGRRNYRPLRYEHGLAQPLRWVSDTAVGRSPRPSASSDDQPNGNSVIRQHRSTVDPRSRQGHSRRPRARMPRGGHVIDPVVTMSRRGVARKLWARRCRRAVAAGGTASSRVIPRQFCANPRWEKESAGLN